MFYRQVKSPILCVRLALPAYSFVGEHHKLDQNHHWTIEFPISSQANLSFLVPDLSQFLRRLYACRVGSKTDLRTRFTDLPNISCCKAASRAVSAFSQVSFSSQVASNYQSWHACFGTVCIDKRRQVKQITMDGYNMILRIPTRSGPNLNCWRSFGAQIRTMRLFCTALSANVLRKYPIITVTQLGQSWLTLQGSLVQSQYRPPFFSFYTKGLRGFGPFPGKSNLHATYTQREMFCHGVIVFG